MRPTKRNSDTVPDVGGYCRVSTDQQVEHGQSMNDQPEFCRQELDRRFGKNRYTLEMFTDPGASGGSGPMPWQTAFRKGDRKGLWALFEGIRAERFTHVIAYARDRFYRDAAAWAIFKRDLLVPRGIDVLFVGEQDEDFTPEGQLASDILGRAVQFQREQGRKRIADSLRQRVQQGYKLGADMYGYRHQEPNEVQPGKRKSIVPVPEEQAVVRQVKDWYISGDSFKDIAMKLNDGHVPRKKARGKKWETSSVRILLDNCAHAGLMQNTDGELVAAEFFEHRAYEPADFFRIQQVKAERCKRFKGIAAAEPHRLFAKLVSCGLCGRTLRSVYSDTTAAYRCIERRVGPGVGHVYVTAATLQKALLGEIERVTQLPEVLAEAEKCVVGQAQQDTEQLVFEAESLRRHVAGIGNRKAKFYDAVVAGEIEPSQFRELEPLFEDEKNAARTRLAEIEGKLKNRQGREETCRKAVDALRSFPTVWKNLTDTEKREVLRLAVEKAVLNKDEHEMWLELKLRLLDEVRIFLPRRAIDGRYERPAGPQGLTERQLAILWHVLRGRAPKQIAAIFHVTENSIKEVGYRINKHLGVSDLESAARASRSVIERYERFLPLEGEYFQKRNALRLRVMEYRVLTAIAGGETLEELSVSAGVARHRLEKALAKGLAKMDTDDPKDALRLAAEQDLLPMGLKGVPESEIGTDKD